MQSVRFLISLVLPLVIVAISGKAAEAGTRVVTVSYTHLRAHETVLDIVCRLLLEKKNHYISYIYYGNITATTTSNVQIRSVEVHSIHYIYEH